MRRFFVPTSLAAGFAAATIAFAGPALAATSVSVSPSTGLSSGDSVTVTYSGFPANASLFVLECNPKAAADPGSAHCDLTGATPTTADASGAGTAKFTVKTGTIGDGTCTTDCLVAVSDAAGTNAGAGQITFGSASGGTTSGSTGSTGAVSGGTTTSTGKPFGLELGLGALLLALGAGFGITTLRRRVSA